MLHDKFKGKIQINLEQIDNNLNSDMQSRGIAKKPEVALTALLMHFVSLCLEKGKDPKATINQHLDDVIAMAASKK